MNAGTGAGAVVHPDAVIDPSVIVGAYACIGAGVRLAAGCVIAQHVVMEGSIIAGQDVKIGPGALLSGAIELGAGVEIAAGAVIYPGVVIGPGAVVTGGAVVDRSVPAHAIVSGHPARITGYTNTGSPVATTRALAPAGDPAVHQTGVRGVTLHRLPRIHDLRGDLSIGEFGQHVPFAARRYFVVLDVLSEQPRGEHAHRECEQFLVCIKGSCTIMADDGETREEFLLDQPNIGLYLPPMVWGVQYKYSPDAVLLVLASHHYDPDDYIRDYDMFRGLVAGARGAG